MNRRTFLAVLGGSFLFPGAPEKRNPHDWIEDELEPAFVLVEDFVRQGIYYMPSTGDLFCAVEPGRKLLYIGNIGCTRSSP
jgi:hypothetical protein